MNFCEENIALNKNQYGFRSERSCAEAVASVTQIMSLGIDKNSTGHASFIYLQKRFRTVDHTMHLNRLERYEYSGSIHRMMKIYLSNRWQNLDSKGICTHHKGINTGVPQGSLIRPLLFLIYSNDFHGCKDSSNLTMFADESTLITARNLEDFSFQEDVDSLSNWLVENKLTMNVDKCVVFFLVLKIPENLKKQEENKDYKVSFNYLGVHVDKWLRFNQQIDYVVKKSNRFCGLIYSTGHLYPRNCLILFYHEYAKSLNKYGILLYGSVAKTFIALIEKVQRRIAGAVFFNRTHNSLTENLMKNGVLRVF